MSVTNTTNTDDKVCSSGASGSYSAETNCTIKVEGIPPGQRVCASVASGCADTDCGGSACVGTVNGGTFTINASTNGNAFNAHTCTLLCTAQQRGYSSSNAANVAQSDYVAACAGQSSAATVYAAKTCKATTTARPSTILDNNASGIPGFNQCLTASTTPKAPEACGTTTATTATPYVAGYPTGNTSACNIDATNCPQFQAVSNTSVSGTVATVVTEDATGATCTLKCTATQRGYTVGNSSNEAQSDYVAACA